MSLRNLVLVNIAVLTLVACSSAGPAGGTPSAPSATQTLAPPATRIEIKLTDALRIDPAALTVPRGIPVTFVVTNAGSTDHEFFLGDEAAQLQHEKDMASMGGMGHDEPNGIAVPAGQTKSLTYTFAKSGQTLAGCHVSGHYGLGMKATITVAA